MRDQSFWQLASTSGTALGLPAMVIGGQLAKEYGAGIAFTSICVGNVILWVIGLGIISMAQNKTNAIENVKGYLGKKAAMFAALILSMAFLTWYTLQIKGASNALGSLSAFENYRPRQIDIILVGVVLGLVTSLISLGGMQLIKRFCTLAFPLLLCFAVYTMITQAIPFSGAWGFSFSGILSVVLLWLPGIVNLPTLFRHSHSKTDSILGLSMMTLIHAFFQSFTIITGIDKPSILISKYSNASSITLVIAVAFVLLAFICINLVNIYFASASWETFIPRHKNGKEYLFIGILGTLAYAFFQISFPAEFLEVTATSCIASLGIVLLIDFLIRLVLRHRPRPLEKFWSCMCWFIGSIAAIVMQILHPATPNTSLLVGIGISSLMFLIVVFCEETVWSFKKL